MTGATGATGTPGTSLAAGRTLWFESLANVTGTQGANPAKCLGHEESNNAVCPSGTAPNFVYNYKVKSVGTINSLYALIENAPGAGNVNTISVLKNGTAVMACTITGTEVACETTGAVAVVDGDFIQVSFKETTGNATDGGVKTYVTISSIAP